MENLYFNVILLPKQKEYAKRKGLIVLMMTYK